MSVRIYDSRIHLYDNYEVDYHIEQLGEDAEVIILDEDVVLEIRRLDEMLYEIDREDHETRRNIEDQIRNMERTVWNRRHERWLARRAARREDE